jgi:DNA-binding NtrC family response regulator
MVERVLFVDDDEDLGEVMTASLQRLGVRDVIVARSLAEVQARRGDALSCQLAFLDINLGPNAPNGLAVRQWLEREGFSGQTVFLTGHGSNDPRVREAASFAGSRIASKPITLDELRELLAGMASVA